MLNIVICGNSLKLNQIVEDKSIALILTDIPYNISRTNQFHTMGRTGIDFGDWDHNSVIGQLSLHYQYLKPGGSFITFHAFNQTRDIEEALHMMLPKDKLFWHKQNPMPKNTNRRYVADVEMLSWFVKPGKPWIFNKTGGHLYERTILSYPIATHFKKYHPNAKPIELLKELICRHSNPGDTILDPYAGAMTTAVAAAQTDRGFIVCENNLEFFEKGCEFLNKFGVKFRILEYDA